MTSPTFRLRRRTLLAAGAMLTILLGGCDSGAPPAVNAVAANEAVAANASADSNMANTAQPMVAEGGDATNAIPCPFAGNKDWAGWVNAMPGPGMKRTLIVTGKVDVASDGYAGRLTPTFQEEINPPIQHFDLTLVEQAGAKKGWQEVRGDMRAGGMFTAVVIDCHKQQIARISPIGIAQ